MARVHKNGYTVVDSISYEGVEFGISTGKGGYVAWTRDHPVHCSNILEHGSFEEAEKDMLHRVCEAIKNHLGLTQDLCAWPKKSDGRDGV